MCDTHTKNQVNWMIRTCCMRHWLDWEGFRVSAIFGGDLLEIELSWEPDMIEFAP